MKYKISGHNPRVVVDEFGEYVFTYHGMYLSDLFKMVDALNKANL